MYVSNRDASFVISSPMGFSARGMRQKRHLHVQRRRYGVLTQYVSSPFVLTEKKTENKTS